MGHMMTLNKTREFTQYIKLKQEKNINLIKLIYFN